MGKTLQIIAAPALVLLGTTHQQTHVATAFAPISRMFPNYANKSPPFKKEISKSISTSNSISKLHVAGVEAAWDSYLNVLEANPLAVKSVTAGVILGAADLSGQAIQQFMAAKGEQDSDMTGVKSNGGIDIARFLRFAFFGLILQAPWNHFYYLFLDGVLPPTPDPFTLTTGIKVFIDQFIQAPIFTVIIFAFLGTLEGKSRDEIKKQLDDDYVDTMLANWKLWVPATVVNIAFCPPILRVLFLNVVFFFWSIFLSLKLNKKDE